MIKRIVDKKLLEEYREKPCAVCGISGGGLVTGHHIKSKGSGGHDTEENLMAMCFKHHREVHDKGLKTFVNKYPEIEAILVLKNWKRCQFDGTWMHLTGDGWEL